MNLEHRRLADEFIGSALGRTCRIVDCKPLRSSISRVWRCEVRTDGAPISIIIKQDGAWPASTSGRTISREFIEELTVYELTQGLDPAPFIPKAYGFSEDGILLLEDVGDDRSRLLPFHDVETLLARTLARFHRLLQPHVDRYESRRQRLGLHQEDDTRPLSSAAVSRRFRLGCEMMADFFRIFCGRSPEAFCEFLSTVDLQSPEKNDEYRTILHGDLVHSRQCVFNEKVTLLDYEMARSGHGLSDVASLLLGKFERIVDTRQFVLVVPGFGSSLILSYMREYHGLSYKERDHVLHNEELLRALTYHLICLIGWAREAAEGGAIASMQPWIHAAVRRYLHMIAFMRIHEPFFDELAVVARRLEVSPRPEAPLNWTGNSFPNEGYAAG